jgi:hypothetical protein
MNIILKYCCSCHYSVKLKICVRETISNRFIKIDIH